MFRPVKALSATVQGANRAGMNRALRRCLEGLSEGRSMPQASRKRSKTEQGTRDQVPYEGSLVGPGSNSAVFDPPAQATEGHQSQSK